MMMGGTTSLASAALGVHVGHVIRLRPQEKVLGVDAPAVIATMQDLHSGWDLANEASVGNPVDELIPWWGGNAAVPYPCDTAGPKPALCIRGSGYLPAKTGIQVGIGSSGDGRKLNLSVAHIGHTS
jgi:hypothetical protein